MLTRQGRIYRNACIIDACTHEFRIRYARKNDPTRLTAAINLLPPQDGLCKTRPHFQFPSFEEPRPRS